MINLSEIEAAANKAHPGPWYVKENPKSFYIRASDGTYITMLVSGVYATDGNASHIAACSPEVILAMVAAIRAAQEWIHSQGAEFMNQKLHALVNALQPFEPGSTP